jgi:hypothetical protein
MKKKLLKTSLFALVAVFALPSISQTQLSLAAVGNLADARLPDQEPAIDVDPSRRIGLGIAGFFARRGTRGLGLETGAMLMNRSFRYGGENLSLNQSQLHLQVPVLVRGYIGENFSAGAGPFVSIPVGGVQNTFQVGNIETAPFEVERDVIEAGLQAAATYAHTITESTRLFVEGRYSYGMAALNTSDDRYSNINDFSTLLGVMVRL